MLTAAPPAQAGVFGPDPVRDGYASFEDAEFGAALDHWTTAQTAAPNDRTLDYNIGHAHYRLGDFAAAEQAFRAATTSADRDLASAAWYGVGNSLVQTGKYLDAIEAYDATLEIHEDDEDALVNRDIARQRYEKLMEQAQHDQDQREENPPQEQQDDAQAENPEPGEEGQDGEQEQEQEQQQGPGKSEQDPPESGGDSKDQQSGEEEREDQDSGSDDGQAEDKPPESSEQEMMGGAAEAAEVDRNAEAEEDGKSGEVSHNTVEDPDSDDRPTDVIEGALSDEEAETLLRALAADQASRRAERTRREAARGRRAAAKDW